MHSGQTLMVIAAMMLLGTLSQSVNRTLINSSTTSLEMEASLDAISYARSLMDEIMSKEFDQKTTNNVRAFSYSDITAIASLGPDGAEGFTLPDVSASENYKATTMYNDVDDYNNYIRIVRNSRLDNFTLTVRVDYVNEDSPDAPFGSPTFYKRVTITISNPYMTKDTNGNVTPLVMKDLSVYRRYF